MAAPADIDAYLGTLDRTKRETLQALRESILRARPDAVECISYSMPAFRVNGRVVAGFAAFTNHLAYLPHSGSVFEKMGADLDGYERTKSSLHFAAGKPLPDALVAKLLETRIAQDAR